MARGHRFATRTIEAIKTDPAQCHQQAVATGEPQQGWGVPEAQNAQGPHGLQVVRCREDALRSNQAANLKEKREECGTVNQAERTQKEPARDEVIR
jgi:hypothetical protein